MESQKHFLQSPADDGNKNNLQKSFKLFAVDNTKSKQPCAEANLKPGELTPEQLAEVFNWLSLY